VGKAHRIQRVSSIMRSLCLVLALLAPSAVALIWLRFDSFATMIVGINQLPFRPQDIDASTRLMGFIIHMIPGGVAVYALLQGRRLFGLYSEGKIFTLENTRRLSNIARALIVYTLAMPLMRTALSVLLTLHKPLGERHLVISISSDDIGLLFIGTGLLVITWIMDEGRKLAEDNAQIV